MNTNRNKYLNSNAKALRNDMTKEERHLWFDFLKQLPVNINRQKIIEKYIVDFYIAYLKIIIEVDGSQHYEEEGIRADEERDNYLKSLGYTILRYSNRDINKNFDGVCQDIMRNIKERLDAKQ